MAKRCTKRGYRDHIAAKLALASTHRAKSSERNEIRAYKCPTCKRWHLTSIKVWKGSYDKVSI